MSDLSGLRTALKVVDAEASRARQHGLSSFTFFLGLATCVITAFLMGKYPESVWIVYAAEAFLILGWRLSIDCRKTNPRTIYYFLDFCWITNFIIALITFLILINVLDDIFLGGVIPNGLIGRTFPDLGRIICLFSTGPLGGSVIVLNNALVLHDIEHFSGCFIHLWPSLTTLSVRWYPALVMATYPGHFDSLTGFHDPPSGAGMLDLIGLATKAYFVWWVPFTVWMLVHGRHQSPSKTGCATVYLNLCETNGGVRKVIGVRGKTPDELFASASQVEPVVKYMLCHAGMVMFSFVWSACCYKYMMLHLAFCVLLVCLAIYNASNRYQWMLLERYSRALKKHIEKEFPEEAVMTKKESGNTDNKENTKKGD